MRKEIEADSHDIFMITEVLDKEKGAYYEARYKSYDLDIEEILSEFIERVAPKLALWHAEETRFQEECNSPDN